MRHLCLVMCLMLCISCVADYVDPTDLFNMDQMNLELSIKKPVKGDGEENLKNPEKINSPASPLPPEGSLPNKNVKDNPPFLKSGEQKEDDEVSQIICKEDKEAVTILFQQFVMSVVQHSKSMVFDTNQPTEFCLRMKASPYDLSVLQKFGIGDNTALYEAHERLTNLIQHACHVPDTNPFFWLEHKLGLSHITLVLMITVLLIIFLILKTMTTIRLTRSKIWLAVLFIFFTSVAFTWMEMYQKKVADQERVLMDSMTSRCPQFEELSIWERFSNYLSSSVTFQNENCREFYEAMFINPIAQVSPLEAMAVATVKTIVSPLKIIGMGIKEFITALFKDLPLQYTMFLMTLISVLVGLTPFMAFGYRIRIPFLLSIEPTPMPQAISTREVRELEAIQARDEQGQGDTLRHGRSIHALPSSKPTVLSRRPLCSHQSAKESCHSQTSFVAPAPGLSKPQLSERDPPPPQLEEQQDPQSQAQPISVIPTQALSKSQTPEQINQKAVDSCQVHTPSCFSGAQAEDNINSSKEIHDASIFLTPHSSLMEDMQLGEEVEDHASMFQGSRCHESVPFGENFEHLQHSDCEESYFEFMSNDFDNPEPGCHAKTMEPSKHGIQSVPSSKEEPNSCQNFDRKNFEQDLKDLRPT